MTGVVGVDSPAVKLTSHEASQYYSVGPPMMVHVDDLKKIMRAFVVGWMFVMGGGVIG